MKLKDAYVKGKHILRSASVPDADLDAWYLLEFVTGISRAHFYAHPEEELSGDRFEAYLKCLAQRSRRIPLQHITGEQEFMGLRFRVNENVLIPRQDTETVVEKAIDIIRKEEIPKVSGKIRLLDMCTGSGCILLSILYHIRKYGYADAEGIGSDISVPAAETARQNSLELKIKADFMTGDLFEHVKGMFSMIVSNPPYIRSSEIDTLQDEVRLYDPRQALDGKEDGLHFYREIILKGRNFLADGGVLLFETGHDQVEDVSGLMEKAGYQTVTVKKDLAGLDRCVCGRYSSRISI